MEIHQHISLWKGSTNFTSQKYMRACHLLPFWPMLGIINFIFYGSHIVYYFNFISLITVKATQSIWTSETGAMGTTVIVNRGSQRNEKYIWRSTNLMKLFNFIKTHRNVKIICIYNEFVKDKYKLKHSARLFSLGYETTLEGFSVWQWYD